MKGGVFHAVFVSKRNEANRNKGVTVEVRFYSPHVVLTRGHAKRREEAAVSTQSLYCS